MVRLGGQRGGVGPIQKYSPAASIKKLSFLAEWSTFFFGPMPALLLSALTAFMAPIMPAKPFPPLLTEALTAEAGERGGGHGRRRVR